MDLPELGVDFEGKYRLVDILGEGGFARVYQAEDLGAKRTVALKVLKPVFGDYQAATESRFYREVKMLGMLRDPHTVTMFDFGKTADGVLFMVFEYVPGTDLSRVIKNEGVLSPPATVHVLTQVLKSLREAHQAGLLHRDIKPQNIRISEYMGDPLRVTLLDFGIAKPVTPGPEMSAITHAGALVGTPQYMSPEQLLEQELTPASDIYSLGLVAYEMLVGEPAVAGNALADQLRVLGGHGSLHLPPSAPVPPGLRRVVDRMISKEQSNRMQSAEQVLRALEGLHLQQGQDISLDETGALAPAGSGEHIRPITGAQAAPPNTGEQYLPRSGPLMVGSSDHVRVPAQTYPTSANYHGSSDSMMRPVIGEASHSSAQVPLQAHHSYGTTVIGETENDELSVWMLGGAAVVLILLVASVSYYAIAIDDDPAPARPVPQLPVAPPVGATTTPDHKAPTKLDPVITPLPPQDGCGVEVAHRGEVTVSYQDGPLAAVERVPVYVPKSYDKNVRHPLLVAFHDYPGGPRGIIRRSKLDELAEKYGVVVLAYDDSEFNTAGYWDSKDDILNARRATEQVIQSFCIDRRRIFGYGHGAGGKAATRLACDFHGIVATATTAFRPEEGVTQPCDHSRPVPHLSIAATKNPAAPVGGGAECSKFVNAVISLDEYESILRDQGVCADKSQTWFGHALGKCRKWSCEAAERVTCRVDGGREFFGSSPREGLGIDPSCDGHPVDFPHTEVLWKFFDEVAPARKDE